MSGKTEKTCSRCKETKALALFNKHPHAINRRRPECAECTKKYHRARRKSEPQKYPHRKYALKRYFNMTIQQYEKMLEDQDGKCAICCRSADEFSRPLAVDHCHETGKIRGLLCGNCNSGIGLLKDNPKLIAAALQYLLENKGE